VSEEPLRLRLLGAEWRSGRSRRAEASRYVGHGEEQQQGDDISAVPKTSRVLPDDSRKCMKISATSALFRAGDDQRDGQRPGRTWGNEG